MLPLKLVAYDEVNQVDTYHPAYAAECTRTLSAEKFKLGYNPGSFTVHQCISPRFGSGGRDNVGRRGFQRRVAANCQDL
jgi:hypothetical protein